MILVVVLLSIAVVIVVGVLVWLIAARGTGIGLIQQQLDALKAAQDGVRDALQKSLQTGQDAVNRGLQAHQQLLARLNSQIGELQGTNKQMLLIQSDIRRLQEILSAPKLRGQMGEWSLENLLSQVLPKDSYQLQHGFRDGKRVDALVKMKDFGVPIDAKFPLESFEKLVGAEDENEKARLRKQFARDVMGHIDKIAGDYIRPAEGTLDFALMYIPAENVYYETIAKHPADTQDLLRYAQDRKVIPVSPSLLYAYLMTVVMGLHGLQIEKQAEQIRRNLKKLNASFAEFVSTWDTLGGHIRNASNKYDEGQRKLDRFGLQLTGAQGETELQAQAGVDEK